MNLYLVQWEEFDGNDHTVLMVARELDEHIVRERVTAEMQDVDHHFDESDISSVNIVTVTKVDDHRITLTR